MTYYCQTPYEYEQLIDPLIQQVPVVIGVGFTMCSGFGAMLGVLNSTAAYYQDNPDFLGFCIFHEDLLEMVEASFARF
jgi:hypothetical protein